MSVPSLRVPADPLSVRRGAAPSEARRSPGPLPEPLRTRHVSAVGQVATDALGKLLEEWVGEIRVGYTQPGD